jgi:hypothetical protein
MANTGLFVVPNLVVQTAVSTAGAADTTTPASNLGLIVFLPLVGAILGAVVGAVGGAWANSWYRNREAEKARDEEREGLLILLSDEVATNNHVFDLFLEQRDSQPQFDNRVNVAVTLHSAVWDESKARLAQLLIPGAYLATVASYYRRIDLMRQDWTMPRKNLSEDDTERVREIRGNGISVLRATQDYISDPRIFAPLLDEDV